MSLRISFAEFAFLLNDLSLRLGLPTPLLLMILDYANLNPTDIAICNRLSKGCNSENKTYIELELRHSRFFSPRRVLIQVNSKDQGWSSYPQDQGTRTSHTWGEISLSTGLKRYEVYRNIHAGKEWELHNVTFEDCPFLQELIESFASNESLKVLLWSRSLYPGWANHINYAKITVEYGLQDPEELLSYLNHVKLCNVNNGSSSNSSSSNSSCSMQ